MVVHASDITIIHQWQAPEGAILTVKLSADEPFRKIRWKRYLRIPGLFDGEHRFEIWENLRRITQLVHSEIFTGLLLLFLSGTLSDTKLELEKMNAAIRNLAEQRTV
jgi:hypothetical protein